MVHLARDKSLKEAKSSVILSIIHKFLSVQLGEQLYDLFIYIYIYTFTHMLYSHIHVQAALRIYCHFCILFLVINIAPIECLQRVYLTKHLMFKRFLFVLWNDEKSSKALFLSKQCDPFNSKLVKVLKMMKDVLVYERKQTSRRDVLFWWVHSIIWNIWLH